MSFYPDIIGIFNSRSDADDSGSELADAMAEDRPFGMEDVQEWADSIAIAGGVLGAAYEDAGMLGQGQFMRPEEPEPAKPAFDPDDCTILRAPMTLRRGSISLSARKAGLFL